MSATMRQPVLLDTDIGTDIDDAYALILAAVSPELDLRAVTTVNSDTLLRARIARRLLDRLGRADVPVAVGALEPLAPAGRSGWGGHEGRGIDLPPVGREAFDARPASRVIADCAAEAHAAGTPLTLLPIGAMTNVARAILDHPREVALIGRIVAMASTFEGFGPGNARGEHNVACDPEAFRVVLESGIPLTLIGLNVTRWTEMSLAEVEGLEALGGPLAEDLSGMHRVWFEWIKRDHSPMHDGLAVAAAFRSDLVRLVRVTGFVSPPGSPAALEGVVTYNTPAVGEVTRVEIADDLEAEAFRELLMKRVRGAVLGSLGNRVIG